MYMGGGASSGGEWSKSVLMCEVHELLQSTATQRHSQGASPRDGMVWRQVADLPVTQSALVTIQGQLLAVGGHDLNQSDGTSEVCQYDTATNSWKVISHMKNKGRYLFAAVLPNDQLMVVGGGRGASNLVEIASVV